jgi:hypothetical protein
MMNENGLSDAPQTEPVKQPWITPSIQTISLNSARGATSTRSKDAFHKS